ncbi:MAG: radical SAM protein, partial [Thermoproteota archaeon]
CNFGPCVFCQNWDISSDPENGTEVDPRTLALISKRLRTEGAANINYVGGDPTPNLHTILASLKHLNVNVPQLWNSNMYCSVETMKLLAEVIDIWLPDFKYGNNECAKRLSKVDDYFEVVSRNHKIAYENGDMIIRHLVLPNHIECCTKPVLKWISENTPKVLVNIMEQYHPDYLVARNPEKYPDIARRPASKEMREAYDYARGLGIVFEPVS